MHIGVSRIAFEIGSISVGWYGIFMALAVIWLILWMWWQVARKGAKISLDTVMSMALVGIPSGIIFARLLHVVDNIVIARLHPELALTSQVIDYLQYPSQIIGGSGLTIYGAVLGASLGLWIYCKIAKVKIGYVFDLLAPAVLIAQVLGRIGCTLNQGVAGFSQEMYEGGRALAGETASAVGDAVAGTYNYIKSFF